MFNLVKYSSTLNFAKNFTTESDNLTNSFQQNQTENKKEIELDIDLSLDDLSSLKNYRHDDSFKFNELILCKTFNKKSKLGASKYVAKIIKIEENGIFRNKYLDIFHEHIIQRSKDAFNFNQNIIKKEDDQNTNASFSFKNIRIDFKRPNLYEYVSFRVFDAVPSHFSIITLVPLLLELETNSKVLECGTGSGSMSLFLSKYLGEKSGVLHTFDINKSNCMNAKKKFLEWKSSYDIWANEGEKWASNVKFGQSDFCQDERLNKHFENFYDAIYLDMSELESGIERAYTLLKPNGVVVVNGMQLTQIIRCLNRIEKKKLGLEAELVLEPANRLWEMRKILRNAKISDEGDWLNWTCRLEDRFAEKVKRGGLYFNYWQGFLAKFRKIK